MNKYFSALLLSFISVLFFVACQEKSTESVIILWQQNENGYNNYRIPSLIVTQKNTLLAFCEAREAGDTGEIHTIVKRSVDNGKTWSEQAVVWGDVGNTYGNPCPVIDQTTGRIVLLSTWNLGTDRESDIIEKRSKNTRIPYVCYSDDDGITWSEPQSIILSAKDPDWGWYATGPGIGIQLKNTKYKNRLVIPCNNSYSLAGEDKKWDYGSHVIYSDDGGLTWEKSQIIMPKVNESQVVELHNGDLMINMRSYHGKASRAVAYSYDGGQSWTEVSHNAQLQEPVCQAGFIDFGNYKGKSLYLFSNPATTHGRTHMTVKASFDNAENWTNSKLIFAGASAYSSMAKLPNGTIGLLFEAGNEHAYESIVFVSFPPEALFSPDVLLPKL
ncbi:MAG: sialidase family protein [Capnocytophaga sp.]|nr:sialidase family protein [Capnocytophaga sp.]